MNWEGRHFDIPCDIYTHAEKEISNFINFIHTHTKNQKLNCTHWLFKKKIQTKLIQILFCQLAPWPFQTASDYPMQDEVSIKPKSLNLMERKPNLLGNGNKKEKKNTNSEKET